MQIKNVFACLVALAIGSNATNANDIINNEDHVKQMEDLLAKTLQPAAKLRVEWGGAIYQHPGDNKIQYKTWKGEGDTVPNFAKNVREQGPAGYHPIAVWHTHPNTAVQGCVPSGFGKKQGDVTSAQANFDDLPYFVVTGTSRPKGKGGKYPGEGEAFAVAKEDIAKQARIWVVKNRESGTFIHS